MRISNDLLASDYVWHKRWQITIADLVYLLLSKGKSHNDEIQSNFSENIENLFNLIDMIDIYLDSTHISRKVTWKSRFIFSRKLSIKTRRFPKIENSF